jgi:hypothetical protein
MFFELSYQEGCKKRKNVATVVCSSAWLDAIVPEDENGVVQGYHDDLYPPGGNATLMRECVACRRVSPQNGHAGICCDCEVEQAESAHAKQRRRASRNQISDHFASDWKQLEKRWWRRPIVEILPDRSAEQEDVSSNGPPSYDDHSGNGPSGSDRLPGTYPVDRRIAREDACRVLGLPSPLIRFSDPIPRSSLKYLPGAVAAELNRIAESFDRQAAKSVRAVSKAFRNACRSLGQFHVRRDQGNIVLRYDGRTFCLLRCEPDMPTRGVSIGSGRSAGCPFQLLSEKVPSLKKEIADCLKKIARKPENEVLKNWPRYLSRRVKRFTSGNPRDYAPEDWLGMRAFINGSETSGAGERKGIDERNRKHESRRQGPL